MNKKDRRGKNTKKIGDQISSDVYRNISTLKLSPYYFRVPYQYTSAEVYDEQFREMYDLD